MKDTLAEQLGAETAALVQTIGYGSLAPAFAKSVELAHKSIGQNFAATAAPHGGAWPPRKVKGDGHPLLIDTGKLFLAATSAFGAGSELEIRDRDASVGVDSNEVPYAAAQNFGIPERNLPQREFEDVSDAAMDQMADLIADGVIELLDGQRPA